MSDVEERLRGVLREACRATGEIAGALARRRLRSGDLGRWAEAFASVSVVLLEQMKKAEEK